MIEIPGQYSTSYSWSYATGCAWYPWCKPCDIAVDIWLAVYEEKSGRTTSAIERWDTRTITPNRSWLFSFTDEFSPGNDLYPYTTTYGQFSIDNNGVSHIVSAERINELFLNFITKIDSNGLLVSRVQIDDLPEQDDLIFDVYETVALIDGGEITVVNGANSPIGMYDIAVAAFDQLGATRWVLRQDPDLFGTAEPKRLDCDKAGNSYIGVSGDSGQMTGVSIFSLNSGGEERWRVSISTGDRSASCTSLRLSSDGKVVTAEFDGPSPTIRGFSSVDGSELWSVATLYHDQWGIACTKDMKVFTSSVVDVNGSYYGVAWIDAITGSVDFYYDSVAGTWPTTPSIFGVNGMARKITDYGIQFLERTQETGGLEAINDPYSMCTLPGRVGVFS